MADIELSAGFNWSAARTGLEELRAFSNNATRGIQRDIAGIFSGSGLAGIISVAAIEQGIKGLVEYGAKIYDIGKRFAVSTTAVQQFGNAAELNGVSIEKVALGFNRLDIATSKALGGNQHLIQSFANLGVTVDDLKNLTPEQIMLKIGQSSMNAADMVLVLGRNGTELRTTLSELAKGAKELGNAIDPGTIAALKHADDSFKIFWQNARIYGAATLNWIAQRSADVYSALVPEFVQKAIGFGPAKPAQPVPSKAGGQAGSAQTDLEAAMSGAGGAGSRESTADKIAQLEEAHAARARTAQENLNLLSQKHVELAQELADAEGDQDAKQQALLALAENQKDIDVLHDNLAKDALQTASQITAEREKAAAQADQSLAKSKEGNRELQLELQGRTDLAEKAKIAYGFDEKIATAAREKVKAEKAGDTAVAATNAALIQQLKLEKGNALAAYDKARAEEAAAKAAEDAAKARQEKKNTEGTQRDLDKLREQRSEQELINQGLGDQAEAMRRNFDYQEQINAADEKANSLWENMVEAYRKGDKLLGDQLAKHAKLVEELRRELELEKEKAEQDAYAESWQKGLQKFANNAAGYSAETLTRSGVGYSNYADKRQQFIDQQKAAYGSRGGPWSGKFGHAGEVGDLSHWAGRVPGFEALIAGSHPTIPTSSGNATVDELKKQIDLLSLQLQQLQELNRNLKPTPGGH